MPDLWLSSIAILAGFAGLIWSADRFVGGSAAIAHNMGISKLVIGLTIVSLGTSAPEVVVAISAGLKGAGDLAVGNAIGSNLANIGLVLAITALVAPLPIQRHVLKQELPILILVTALAGFLLYDAELSFFDGSLLLGLLLPLMVFMVRWKSSHPSPEEEDTDIPTMANTTAGLWFMIGLTALIISSELLVWGATKVAVAAGVSPLIIGLTVIAVGTSLPELAASVMSALKGHSDIALGNIVGSNIFNLLAVMAVPGLIQPTSMGSEVFYRDYAAMAGITLILAAAVVIDFKLRNHSNHARLGRRIGISLLALYLGYYVLLFNTQ